MKYPDGSTIEVGDLVWWNGGSCVGFVQRIAESSNDYEEWGLESPHIFINTDHPFDQSVTGIAYPEHTLADDGIGRLTTDERDKLERAMIRARERLAPEFRNSTCFVRTDIQANEWVAWVITFHRDGTPIDRIVVPFA